MELLLVGDRPGWNQLPLPGITAGGEGEKGREGGRERKREVLS